MSFAEAPYDVIAVLLKLTLWCGTPFLLWPWLRRWSAAQRHLVLTLTIAGTLVLPFLAMWVPSFDGPNLLPARASANARVVPKTKAESKPMKPADSAAVTQKNEQWRERVVPMNRYEIASERAEPTLPAPKQKVTARKAPGLATTALAIWLVGSGLLTIRLGRRFSALRALRRTSHEIRDPRTQSLLKLACRKMGYRKCPDLRESETITIPLASAFGGGLVLLPTKREAWSETRLRRVLLHEVAHLYRRDGWAMLLGHLATIIYWYHPLIWVLHAWSQREAEGAADNSVLLAGEPPSGYAKELLTLAQGFHPYDPPEVCLTMLNPLNLKSRLVAVLDPEQRRSPVKRGVIAFLALFATVLAGLFAGAQLSTPTRAEVGWSLEQNLIRGLDFTLPSDSDLTGHAPTRWQAASQSQSQNQSQNQSDDQEKKRDLAQHADHHDYKVADKEKKRARELYGDYRFAEAAQAYRVSAEADDYPATSYYNAACSASLADDAELALDLLRRSLDAGWDDPRYLANDSDFDPIRADNRFQQLVDESFTRNDKKRRVLKDYRLRNVVESYEALQQKNSSNGKAWYDTGTDLLSLRRFDEAEDALTRAVRILGEDSDSALYNLACMYSLEGDIDRAASTLRQAVENGFNDPGHMRRDSDLANLRASADFASIIELADDLNLDRFRRRMWEKDHKIWREDHSEYSPEIWAPAIEFYSAWVERMPQSGRGWNNLAWSQHHSRHFADAIASFEKASELEYRPGISAYNIACGYAMLGQNDEALDWLERALASGFIDAHHAENDSDLENLRDDPKFRRLLCCKPK